MTPTFSGIAAAADLLEPYARPTPLVRAPLLSRRLGCEVFVKNETVSPIASFKWRGALTDVLRHPESARGVVTSSTGNHGQGVAWAASVAGITAHVFLPIGANAVKRAKIAMFGAAIHETGHDLDEAKVAALAFARDERLLFIDDGESIGVIEGAGTIGLEIVRELPRIDAVFVPMGSGSLAGGIGLAVKEHNPRTRVIAVQSSGSRAMVESFRARRPVELPAETLADGLICRVPARVALDALLQGVDDAVTVEEDELLRATYRMMTDAHLLVEPSAAASLAAAERMALTGKTIVLIATGANVTPEVLRRVMELGDV